MLFSWKIANKVAGLIAIVLSEIGEYIGSYGQYKPTDTVLIIEFRLTEHLKGIFEYEELEEKAVCRNFRHTTHMVLLLIKHRKLKWNITALKQSPLLESSKFTSGHRIWEMGSQYPSRLHHQRICNEWWTSQTNQALWHWLLWLNSGECAWNSTGWLWTVLENK